MAFTELKATIKPNKKEFKKSVRRLRTRLPRVLRQAMKRAGKDIALNVKDRFKANYGNVKSPAAKSVLDNIRSSELIEDSDSFFIGVGNIERLDRTTRVMAKGSGKTYELWRLMEEGFGLKGGFRSDRYIIRPVASSRERKRSSEGLTAQQSAPALVFRVNGNLVFTSQVKHPGAAGRHFFLSATDQWYREDLLNLKLNIANRINKLLKDINYNG